MDSQDELDILLVKYFLHGVKAEESSTKKASLKTRINKATSMARHPIMNARAETRFSVEFHLLQIPIWFALTDW
jgi:hypothetical protein